MTNTTLSAETMHAISQGFHSDPYPILGAHLADGQITYRTFQPHVQSVNLQVGKKTYPMEKVHVDGIYEYVQSTKRKSVPSYTYELIHQDGNPQVIVDPYHLMPVKVDWSQRWYDFNGARIIEHDGKTGTLFTVWAPNADRVSLVGTFNDWDGRRHVMRKNHETGMWQMFLPGIGEGALYKYEIKTQYKGYMVTKTDPAGYFCELRPKNASIVWDIENYTWGDDDWVNNRSEKQARNAPMSIYEVHPGSWRRKGDGGWEWLSYRELAETLVPYVKEMGFTHIELMPIAEHPFDGSWGYQVTGYFAPTSRFGTPQDLMYFIDVCHQNDIGVLLDWVPAHFPKDENGLGFFDGTYLYEHADPRKGEHPDWGTKIFNYGRGEVRRFLIDNALFWLDKYHFDGLRVDAVASMLYLDFSREPNQWVPNRYGGRENIDALEFLREVNIAVHASYPGTLMIAEESTAWPGVTRPPEDEGGLGFDYKWNMGWMNDTLRYMSTDPLYRSYHQGTLTFSLLYAFSETFILPFSHDEVVHLKRSMVDKMPGDGWQKFANLRALFGYMFAHPGRKLNFMGNEIAQWTEWSEAKSLDWHLLDQGEHHLGVQTLMKDLNHTYRSHPALYAFDDDWEGFEWIDIRDASNSVLIFLRKDPSSGQNIVVACNFTPQVHHGYRIGVPEHGEYIEFLNTDHVRYGGSGVINEGTFQSEAVNWHDRNQSILVTLPPLSTIYFRTK